ncbi:amidase domain-containing protein [Clostridium tunisiense]|uniref:amidase domain-containing protein n=1 Tax=Clostridium tunisiense TaxID=219748 RepID=UPI000311513C|nr:amidase domain-containing protein [Clostridium tunisiense]
MKRKKLLTRIKDAIITPLLNDEIINRQITVYNRSAAKAYAEAYAESPNIKEYPLFKEDDCTNFISQVLKAGGMIMKGRDYTNFNHWFCYTKDVKNLSKISLTWRSARYFRKYWGNENGVGRNAAREYRELIVLDALTNFQDLYDYLEIGDVIQYGDPKKNNYPYHSQVIHAKEYNVALNRYDLFIAQHTANRKNVSLYEYLKLLQNKANRYIYIYHF